ncbi:metal ABC transporter permease [Sediminitomix flava]|uniref:Manganese/zinc/iron transport system permease protein n=1 Tax=Sediminitomix flava TaxID=379075 RepID=A0A315Z7E7_SEDFL|nr:metal ABC transporter permease [Sediminitomix flava]PWJ40064.1 manganese/zinc/iron transport system permease protein [Sediminitomix flava]
MIVFDEFWIMLTGALVAISCSLLGCFLVLRKVVMVGDAISHAVLPGIVIAYFFSQSLDSLPMLIGAAAFGMIATVIIEMLSKKNKMQEDAAIGVTFTFLFALGVILITSFADKVDLDQECVLYGEIAYVPLDTLTLFGGVELGPVQVWILGFNLLLVLAFVILGYTPLKMSSFDPIFCTSVGISTSFWHYALMSGVSMTTVFSFEAVGAILVVAFLVGPPSIAYLISKDLKKMLWLAALFGVLSSVFGYLLAVLLNASIAGSMVVMIGIFFIIVLSIQLIRKQLKDKRNQTEISQMNFES